jgi:1,4-dihydroxy-2-naphthoyl-CoA hydrolase
MTLWKSPISLDALKQRGQNTLVDHLEIEFTDIGDDYLIASMPVNEHTRQPLGLLHGGASCVLAETVGSMAANYAVDFQSYYCVGLSIYTQHIRAIKEGTVYAKATALHLGRSTQVWNIDMTDRQERLIATTRLTMAVLTQPTEEKTK